MYNAEKYIGECLDSILAQTFDDYEVIVVDDCSTDNSCAVVESYAKKFKNKLQLVHSEINSGGGGYVPRNTGIRLSRGEYLLFVDIDDVITKTALEELYRLAKKFNADVIHCRDFYISYDDKIKIDKEKLFSTSVAKEAFGKNPVPMPFDLAKRVIAYVTNRIWTAPWNYLYLRDFIVKNDIKFPTGKITQDAIFSFFVLCSAKVFINVPNVFYVYRQVDDSIVRKNRTADEAINIRGSSLFKGIITLDKFMNRFEFFKENPEYKYMVFDYWTQNNFNILLSFYAQMPAYELDKFIRRELEPLEDKDALTAYLFGRMNIFNLNFLQQEEKIQQLQDKLNQAGEYLAKQQKIIADLENELKQK